MATRTKLNILAVHRLFVAGEEFTPVEAPSHIGEDKPSNRDLAIAHNELIEALKSAGVFLPDVVAPEAAQDDDEDADGE